MDHAVTSILYLIPARDNLQFFVAEKGLKNIFKRILMGSNGGTKFPLIFLVGSRVGEPSRGHAYAGDL